MNNNDSRIGFRLNWTQTQTHRGKFKIKIQRKRLSVSVCMMRLNLFLCVTIMHATVVKFYDENSFSCSAPFRLQKCTFPFGSPSQQTKYRSYFSSFTTFILFKSFHTIALFWDCVSSCFRFYFLLSFWFTFISIYVCESW